MLNSREILDAIRQLSPQEADETDIKRLISALNRLLDGESTTQQVIHELQTLSSTATLIRNLAGREIISRDALIYFGTENQMGDITIRDIAGRDIVTLNINIFTSGFDPQKSNEDNKRFESKTRTRSHDGGSTPLDTIFQAPALPPHFVARTDVTNSIRELLLEAVPSNGVLVVSAIHGLGGIGKTTLAAALAHDITVQERFQDGVLWATLGQNPDILSLLDGWTQALGDHSFKALTPHSASNHLRSLLHKRAVLIIIDDIWEPSHLEHFLVGGRLCYTLVTTRETVVASASRARLINLDVMTPEQSLALLTKGIYRQLTAQEHDDAIELAEEVAHLPLALELAAAQIASGVSLLEIVEELRKEIARLEILEPPGIDNLNDVQKRNLSLEATFSLSVKRLSNEQIQAFCWLGILPEDTTLNPKVASMLWKTSFDQARKTLRLLRSKALLFPAASSQGEYYKLHDLVHDFARKQFVVLKGGDNDKLTSQEDLLREAHKELIYIYYSQTSHGLWHTLPDDEYIHNRLIWHFDKGGEYEHLHSLFRETIAEDNKLGWYVVREKLGQVAGFLNDIDSAQEITIAHLNSTEVTEERMTTLLDHSTYYAMVKSSVVSLVSSIPPDAIVNLVKENIWPPSQGLTLGCTGSDERKAKTIKLLTPFLEYKDLNRAIQINQQIRDAHLRLEVILVISRRLSKNEQQQILKTAIQSVSNNNNRHQEIGSIIQEIFNELLEAQITLDGRSFGDYYVMLVSCALEIAMFVNVPYLNKEAFTSLIAHGLFLRYRHFVTTNMSERAIHEIGRLESPETRLYVLQYLVKYIIPKSDMLLEMLAIIRTGAGDHQKAYTLAAMNPYLADALAEEAVSICETFANDHAKIVFLRSVLPTEDNALLVRYNRILNGFRNKTLASELKAKFDIQTMEPKGLKEQSDTRSKRQDKKNISKNPVSEAAGQSETLTGEARINDSELLLLALSNFLLRVFSRKLTTDMWDIIDWNDFLITYLPHFEKLNLLDDEWDRILADWSISAAENSHRSSALEILKYIQDKDLREETFVNVLNRTPLDEYEIKLLFDSSILHPNEETSAEILHELFAAIPEALQTKVVVRILQQQGEFDYFVSLMQLCCCYFCEEAVLLSFNILKEMFPNELYSIILELADFLPPEVASVEVERIIASATPQNLLEVISDMAPLLNDAKIKTILAEQSPQLDLFLLIRLIALLPQRERGSYYQLIVDTKPTGSRDSSQLMTKERELIIAMSEDLAVEGFLSKLKTVRQRELRIACALRLATISSTLYQSSILIEVNKIFDLIEKDLRKTSARQTNSYARRSSFKAFYSKHGVRSYETEADYEVLSLERINTFAGDPRNFVVNEESDDAKSDDLFQIGHSLSHYPLRLVLPAWHAILNNLSSSPRNELLGGLAACSAFLVHNGGIKAVKGIVDTTINVLHWFP